MTAATIRLAEHLRAGDLIVTGSGVGEPESLVAAMREQVMELPDVEIFAGIGYSAEFTAELASATRLSSFGAMGEIGKLAAAGLVNVLPINYVDVAKHLRVRGGSKLVLMIQVSTANEFGEHSFGVAVDYSAELIDDARLIIAEVNDQWHVVPGPTIQSSRIGLSVPVSRAARSISTAPIDEVQVAIARHVVSLISDGAVLQLGIGGVPSAVASLLAGQRSDLRVHTGLVGDWILELDAAGTLSPTEPIVIGGAAGSSRLYDFLASDARVQSRRIDALTRTDITAGIAGFVALNSAVQVDLTGQVNGEVAGDRYLGGVGGQVDFLRGAQLSDAGVSIIALPATASGGRRSRIVRDLDRGVVTTPRSGVDFVITEFGIADLRGRGLAERASALAEIAAPEFRSDLTG